MVSSLQQLLASSINYSALEPPAELSLQQALRGFVDFSYSKYSWMLSSFVMPIEELSLMATFADKKDQLKGPLELCISGLEAHTLFEFKHGINRIEKETMNVHSGYPGEVRTNILELKLPAESVANMNPEELVKALEAAVSSFAESRLLPHRVFFEVPGDEFDADITKKITKVIAVHNKSIMKRKVNNYLFSGLKIKCSGTNVPSEKYLADVILFARDANVAIKFSGIDNALFPTYNYSLQSKVHGMLNILLASILSYTQDLNLEETTAILEDKNPEHFAIKEGYLAWKSFAAPLAEIKMLRMLSITSFNISSFTPIVEGLKELSID
ncbi:MAG: hypothetical protein ED557_10725 [Balneola sp.]|nr:MAG: hypothetical protein ED557_10725 [Balneola sp.]